MQAAYRIRTLGIATLLIAAGCAGPVASTSGSFDETRASLAVAFGSISEEAQRVTHRSAQSALLEARQAAAKLEEQLMAIPRPSALERARVEELHEQIARLDAAILYKGLQTEIQAVVARVAERGSDLEAARRSLSESDPDFKALDERLAGAERAYREACNRLAAKLKAGAASTP